MTSSNGNIFRVTGPLCGEFTGSGPVTRSFDVFFDLSLNKRLSKQPWGWWFETPSCALLCQCNGSALPPPRSPHNLIVIHNCKHSSSHHFSRSLLKCYIWCGRYALEQGNTYTFTQLTDNVLDGCRIGNDADMQRHRSLVRVPVVRQ